MPVKVNKELNPAALPVQGAANYIGSSKSELDTARITGELSGMEPPKFFRIGRSIRYRVVDLDKWLESRVFFTTNAQAETAIA